MASVPTVTFGENTYSTDYRIIDPAMRVVVPSIMTTFESPDKVYARVASLLPSSDRPVLPSEAEMQEGGWFGRPVLPGTILPAPFLYPGLPFAIRPRKIKSPSVLNGLKLPQFFRFFPFPGFLRGRKDKFDNKDPLKTINDIQTKGEYKAIWSASTTEWKDYEVVLNFSTIESQAVDIQQVRLLLKFVFNHWYGTDRPNPDRKNVLNRLDVVKRVTVNAQRVTIEFISFIHRLLFAEGLRILKEKDDNGVDIFGDHKTNNTRIMATTERFLKIKNRWSDQFKDKNVNSNNAPDNSEIPDKGLFEWGLKAVNKHLIQNKQIYNPINDDSLTTSGYKTALSTGGGADNKQLRLLEAMFMQEQASQIYAKIIQTGGQGDASEIAEKMCTLIPAYANAYYVAEALTELAQE
tara:strand:+ start:2711 stop:3931 length:1221 start_codon:yes stop_codon:yes gene_type:complete